MFSQAHDRAGREARFIKPFAPRTGRQKKERSSTTYQRSEDILKGVYGGCWANDEVKYGTVWSDEWDKGKAAGLSIW